MKRKQPKVIPLTQPKPKPTNPAAKRPKVIYDTLKCKCCNRMIAWNKLIGHTDRCERKNGFNGEYKAIAARLVERYKGV